jgi:hypothetical protein
MGLPGTEKDDNFFNYNIGMRSYKWSYGISFGLSSRSLVLRRPVWITGVIIKTSSKIFVDFPKNEFDLFHSLT